MCKTLSDYTVCPAWEMLQHCHRSWASTEKKRIKPLLVITCAALAIKLMSDPTHPVRIWFGF